jgi:hypothetical protein
MCNGSHCLTTATAVTTACYSAGGENREPPCYSTTAVTCLPVEHTHPTSPVFPVSLHLQMFQLQRTVLCTRPECTRACACMSLTPGTPPPPVSRSLRCFAYTSVRLPRWRTFSVSCMCAYSPLSTPHLPIVLSIPPRWTLRPLFITYVVTPYAYSHLFTLITLRPRFPCNTRPLAIALSGARPQV